MVKRFLKIEFIRICRWQTLLAFIIFMGAFIHISVMNKPNFSLNQSNFFIGYFKALCVPMHSYMSLIFPLVIILIFGDSLFLDYKTSFLQFSLSRITHKEFIRYKTIAISLVSFIVTLGFQLVAFLYSIITSPYHLPTKPLVEGHIIPTVSLDLYVSNPFIYIFIVMILFSIISMVITVSGLITSNIFKNIFAVQGIPWIMYIFIGELLICAVNGTSIYFHISPIQMIGYCLFDENYSFIEIFLYWIILWIVSYFATYKLFMRKFRLSL
ncbi:hypothetical protein [Clostridium estertheticum]|uniref:Uncharacterized protein n=1 Tax=Clostridium estertheticum subsp. estertheticum TaxID=1552 RepID=A0A1J0GBM7_9CLOT|nr:hypothetical protein [Clostridium estertheticum]APC38745.1 hypothetical protein A7L45_00980 [Clostridium estertheticum subsp. estertheticum]MBU3074645.1 hypothetical protein [Clostridium estertheticum]MBU3164643.1 hypothetical protein [Clostridium estertheticum]MBZ9615399.1 hypothetical protein [Clostridium estertheticum subsp. laramiense]WAG75285.1 hypothetical protein LL032_07510 [Clostridium estertheticum]